MDQRLYTQAEMEAARTEGAKAGCQIAPLLRGLLKSWTAWLGALLVGLPELWPLLEPHVRELVSASVMQRVVQVVGIVVIVLRFKTTQSLKEKGS